MSDVDGEGLIIDPADHLIAGITWSGFTVEGSPDGAPVLVAASGDAWLGVSVPPQHVAESPVNWSFADNTVPAVSGGRQVPPDGEITVGNSMHHHGPAGVDDSGTVFTYRPLPGRAFPPGAPVAVVNSRVFAIDNDGILCAWRATAWEALDESPASRGFEPGARVVAQELPNNDVAVFAYRSSTLTGWIQSAGWLPEAPFPLTKDSCFAPIGRDVLGVVTVRDNRLHQLVPHLDGSGWEVTSSLPYRYADRLRDGSGVSSVRAAPGIFSVVCDTTGAIVCYQWDPSAPGWSWDLWSGFPPSASVTAVRNTSQDIPFAPGVYAMFWVFAVDASGVLRAAYVAWLPGMGSGESESLGDWFPPGGPVAASDYGENAPRVFAVAADRTIRSAAFSAGVWSTHGNPPDWTPLAALPPRRAQLSGPSMLRVALPQGERLELTAAGLRSALARWDLVSSPAADPVPATLLELPWGLWLTISDGTAIRAVSPPPAGSPHGTHEVWQSRLVPADTAPGQRTPVSLKPFWSREDSSFDPSLAERPALPQVERESIVRASPPVHAQPILSGAGGWLSAQASWPDNSWEHEAVVGRDIRIRRVRQGILLPFGHEATYIEEIERRFDPRGARTTAILHRTGVLKVTNPTVTVPEDATRQWRSFPFREIELAQTTLSALDPPAWAGSPGALRFWPSVSGRQVEFTVSLRQNGHEAKITVPLLFAETVDDDAVVAARTVVSDVDVRSSPLQLVGDNVVVVHSLQLELTAVSGTVRPAIRSADVSLPALDALVGDTTSKLVSLSEDWLQRGNPDRALVLQTAVDVAFGNSEHSGGVATPSFVADGISAAGGLVRADALSTIDPNTFFGELPAKLLGMIDLKEVITAAGVLPRPPLITTLATPGLPAPRVSMRWERVALGPVGPFRPRGNSELTLEIETTATQPNEPPVTRTSGQVSNFVLGLAGILDASFGLVRFAARSGEKPVIGVDDFRIEFGGDLKFLDILVEAMAAIAHDPPVAVTAGPDAIVVSKTVALPDLSLGAGVFSVSLRHAAFSTRLRLPFDGALELDVSFGTRKDPFLVGVWILGGGGYVEVELRDGRLHSLVAAVEIGGLWSFDWFVVAGEVHALAGIRLELTDGAVKLSGYLRIGGSVEVLGLISVGIEISAEIGADNNGGRLRVTAAARLAIEVDLFLTTAEIELEQEVVIYEESPERDPAVMASPAPSDTEPGWFERRSDHSSLSDDDLRSAWHDYAAAFRP